MYSSNYCSFDSAVQQVRRQAIDKRDYLVPMSELRAFDGDIIFRGMRVEASGTFHGQLAEVLGIPTRYYHKMRVEKPQLWEENVQAWLSPRGAEEKLVRTYTGDRLRALLSPSFARIDHEEVLNQLAPALDGCDLELKAYDFTSDRLSLKLISPKIEGEVAKGDIVRVGLEISNSETGCGVVQVTPLIYRLVCTNGMIAGSALGEMRRRHKGRRVATYDGTYLLGDGSGQINRDYWRAATQRIERILSADGAQEILRPLQVAAEARLVAPAKALKAVVAQYRLDEDEAKKAEDDWAWMSGDKTVWSLSNVVTALANTTSSYERASELEAAGWDICQAPGKWASIN